MISLQKLLFAGTLITLQCSSYAQDVRYARMLIDSMAAPGMFGRGYVNKGDSLAAAFIGEQFTRIGLKTFGNDYYQKFDLSVNSFPGKADFSINKKALNPGNEYTFHAGSHADNGRYKVIHVTRQVFDNPALFSSMSRKNHSKHYLLFDIDQMKIKSRDTIRWVDSIINNNIFGARGIVVVRPAVSGHVWARPMPVKPVTRLEVARQALPPDPRFIRVDLETRYLNNYQTQNVIGFIKGTAAPDTFLVVTAHYDHLGMMGSKTYYPGAHDNASGVAMLLDLARHFSLPENAPNYSMAFMAFGGEETGLLGSKIYTENPLFPLSQIKFLVNLDMVGTGQDGLIIFNSTADSVRASTIEGINAQHQYVNEIRRRGESRSSDHYHFHQKGVPSFFLLTYASDFRHYHNVFDRPEGLTLSKYNEVFRLIENFLKSF